MENALACIEDKFIKIRDHILPRRIISDFGLILNTHDLVNLYVYTAVMNQRTKENKEHITGFWSSIHQVMLDMKAAYDQAAPDQKEVAKKGQVFSSPRSAGIEEVSKAMAQPMKEVILASISTMPVFFFEMNAAILIHSGTRPFITTDNPCLMWTPRMIDGEIPAFMHEDLEVTMPISPNMCLLISNKDMSGYIDVNDACVQMLNMRHVRHCSELVIASNQSFNVQ